MAEENPRKSLSRDSSKSKNPFSRVKDENTLKSINTMKNKNPFSRVKDENTLKSINTMKNKNPFSRVKDENTLKSINTMRKSWSTNSLSLLDSAGGHGKSVCVCAPTNHQGSFRCRLHRAGAGAGSHGRSFDVSADDDGRQLVLPKTFLSSLAETKES